MDEKDRVSRFKILFLWAPRAFKQEAWGENLPLRLRRPTFPQAEHPCSVFLTFPDFIFRQKSLREEKRKYLEYLALFFKGGQGWKFNGVLSNRKKEEKWWRQKRRGKKKAP